MFLAIIIFKLACFSAKIGKVLEMLEKEGTLI